MQWHVYTYWRLHHGIMRRGSHNRGLSLLRETIQNCWLFRYITVYNLLSSRNIFSRKKNRLHCQTKIVRFDEFLFFSKFNKLGKSSVSKHVIAFVRTRERSRAWDCWMNPTTACFVNASAFASNEVNVNEAQASPDAADPPFYSSLLPSGPTAADAYVRAFAFFFSLRLMVHPVVSSRRARVLIRGKMNTTIVSGKFREIQNII